MELYRAGNYGRAVVVAKKALQVGETNAGKNHPDAATSLNNLARLYDTQGQYAQAEPLYKRAGDRGKGPRPDHPDVALSLNNLAALYRATNRGKEAEALEQQAVRILAIQR